MVVALINCAGYGLRFSSEIPKQYIEIDGKPIFIWTLEKFQQCAEIDIIAICIQKEYQDYVRQMLLKFRITKATYIFNGGTTAQESRFNGISGLIDAGINLDSIIIMHDAVRPFITIKTIKSCVSHASEHDGCICGIKFNSHILINNADKTITGGFTDNSYKGVIVAHMPQGFILSSLLDIKSDSLNETVGYSDLLEKNGKKAFSFVEISQFETIKITHQEDLQFFNKTIY